MIELFFDTLVPSKKNARDIFARGRTVVNRPNQKYRDWHADQAEKIGLQVKGYPTPIDVKPLYISYLFAMPDFRRRDLSNMIQSIEDLLHSDDINLIIDDAWEYLQCGGFLAVHKPGENYCKVWIEDDLSEVRKALDTAYAAMLP